MHFYSNDSPQSSLTVEIHKLKFGKRIEFTAFFAEWNQVVTHINNKTILMLVPEISNWIWKQNKLYADYKNKTKMFNNNNFTTEAIQSQSQTMKIRNQEQTNIWAILKVT